MRIIRNKKTLLQSLTQPGMPIEWPHAAMPLWLQGLGEFLPSTQGIQMFIQLNQMGVPAAIVIPKLIYLSAFGAICLIWAYWRLKLKP